MKVDRTETPVVENINSIKITEPKVYFSPNNIKFHIFNVVPQDMIRIDLMFGAGKWEQNKLLVAMFTNLLIKEGTKNLKSTDITEALDFCGASLQCSATFHNSYVTLYTLNKHLPMLLPILNDIIKNPVFPKEEFDVLLSKRKQSFIVDNQKVDVISYNKYIELLFSDKYPYGNSAKEEDFDKITPEDLKEYHKKYYNSDNCTVILTGNIKDETIKEIEAYFGNEKWGGDIVKENIEFESSQAAPGYYFIEKKDALQASVRIGINTIGRMHEDYAYLRIVNTILGGYFGSRLMSNIREDKGYTYGIGSAITTQKNASYLTISTQTGNEYTEPLIKEVFYEIERLKTELVPEDELENVKGYLMGEMLRLFDGPFSTADAYQALIANTMEVDYYYNMVEAIKSIDSEKIMEIANKYFITDRFYTVVCGVK